MSPTVSYFMLLGGMLVAYIEFIRPGLVVPGVVGGVVSMWGLSRLASYGLNWEASGTLLLGLAILVVQAWFWKGDPRWFRWERWIGGIGVLSMWWGSTHLVNMPLRINPQAAEMGVALFAIISVPLLRTAFQAHRNKVVV
jgi:membrane-bound serine protease (ClpP class)